MRTLIQVMFNAQSALLQEPSTSPNHQALLIELREKVPTPVLAHFLRLVGQGRRGVAAVRHGVCSECHIRVPVSMLPALRRPEGLHLCENCGSYLFLPDEELAPAPAPQARRVRARKSAASAAPATPAAA